MIVRRNVTVLPMDGQSFARANVWTDLGYSTKTFATPQAAAAWLPTSERKSP